MFSHPRKASDYNVGRLVSLLPDVFMTDPDICLSFVWSATTLVVNRALLHVRHVEVREAYIAQHAHLLESRTVIPSGSTPDIDELEDWQLEEQLQERDEGSETLGRDTPLQAELKNFLTWSSRDKSLESSMFNCLVIVAACYLAQSFSLEWF